MRGDQSEVRAADPTERIRAVSSSRSAKALVRALTDPSPEVIRAAIRRLVEVEGARAIPALRSRLLSADFAVVPDIATALAQQQDTGAVDVALSGLSEEPYTRRLAAARALGILGDTRVTQPLRAALQDPIAGVRAAAVSALARVSPDDATAEECVELLSDRDAQVRLAATHALVRIRPRSERHLARLVDDPDALVRTEVARRIARLPESAAERLFGDRDQVVRQTAALSAGGHQVPALERLLAGDRSSEVRRAAARALGGMATEVAVEVLLRGIEDPDALVRAAALHALVRPLTRAGAVSRLSRELTSPRPERRRWTLYALAHLNASEASTDAWRLADDPEPEVRLALIQAASRVVSDPIPLLSYMATDPDAAVQASAATWLERSTPT